MNLVLRILIVDDDADCVGALADAIRVEGMPVVVETAFNGRDALERMRVQPPHLLILDVRMPVMDGLELRKEMLSDPALRDVRVAVFSGQSMTDVERDVLVADHYLRKPVDMRMLRNVVQRAWALVHQTVPAEERRHLLDHVNDLLAAMQTEGAVRDRMVVALETLRERLVNEMGPDEEEP